MHNSAVHEHAILVKVETDLPNPADQRKREKQEHQRTDRIVPHIMQSLEMVVLAVNRVRRKTVRIRCAARRTLRSLNDKRPLLVRPKLFLVPAVIHCNSEILLDESTPSCWNHFILLLFPKRRNVAVGVL